MVILYLGHLAGYFGVNRRAGFEFEKADILGMAQPGRITMSNKNGDFTISGFLDYPLVTVGP